MTSSIKGVPHALLHNLKHNKVLHERVILLTVRIEDVPYRRFRAARQTADYGAGFFRVILRHGFMEEVDVPSGARRARRLRAELQDDGHQLLPRPPDPVSSPRPGMAIWREKLFAWMLEMPKARWSSSSFRPTASSNWAARSKIEISCG